MIKKILNEILLPQINENIEYNIKFDENKLGETVCSFLNTKGGYIVFGATDRNNILGVNLEQNYRELELELSKNIVPKALVAFEFNEDKNILIVEVPSGKDYPYSFKNDIFIRVENTNQKADVYTIRDMVMRRQNEPERWERRFSDVNLDEDLDYEQIDSIVKQISNSERYKFYNEIKGLRPLEDLGVIKYGRLTNAGDILFTKNPAKRKPQIRVKTVCFNVDKTDDTYKDMKTFEGPLFKIFEEVYNFILKNIPTKTYFSDKSSKRKDIYIYPPKAIREGLVNAFVHRDYSNFSGSLSVFIYPEKIEIFNYGEFPKGITIEDKILKNNISILRNPDIAHVTYLIGEMEKLGRGSLLIQKECNDYGLPSPEWKSEKNKGVTLTFFKSPLKNLTPQGENNDTPQDTPQDSPQVKKLLNIINGEMSRDELQVKLELKDRKSFREGYLNPALDLGLIEMTIPDKPNSKNQKYRKVFK